MIGARYFYVFNDTAHFRRFLWGVVILAVLAGCGFVLVPYAHAAAFSCTGSTANGNLMDIDTIGQNIVDASGNPYTINTAGSDTNADPFSTNACPQTLGVIGRLICFFKITIGQIISSMYCSFQAALLGPLSLAVTLFIILTGIVIATGMTRITAREAIVAVLKVALVWTFAMNATWGIGIAYTFFMGLADQGSNLVLGASSGSTSGGVYLTQPDKILTGLFAYTTTGSGNLGLPGTLTPNCLIWLFTLLVLLLLFMPMVGGFIITMIVQYVWLYARALLGYLTALVLLTFLFVLAPLFISFALFQFTRPLFEQWVKYLTSFSLQMVIVFGFLAIMDMVPLGDFFTEVLRLIRQYDTTIGGNNSPIPVTFCSICAYTINSGASLTGTPQPITCSGGAGAPAIPLVDLFASKDFVKTIVAQIVALWIIGHIMQDFIKRAPEFARDLAGNLPGAAALGEGMSGGGIAYPGLDSIESGIESVGQRISGSGFYNNKWWSRLPAAGAALAGLGLAAAQKSSLAQQAGDGSADQSDATPQQSATSGAAQMQKAEKSAAAKPSASASEDDNSLTVRRINLGGDPRTQSYQAAEYRYNAAQQDSDNRYDEVQKEYHNYLDAASVGGPALQMARDALAESFGLFQTSVLNMDESRNTMKEKLTQTPAQRAKSDALAMAGNRGSGIRTNERERPKEDDSQEVRDYRQKTIRNLQLQVEVKKALDPDSKLVQSAQDNLHDVMEKANKPDEDPQALAEKLYLIQNMLI